MKNKNYYKVVAFLLLAVVTGTFTHCVQNSPIGGSASSGSSRSPSSNPPVQTPEQVINQAQVQIGLKNFEQIHYTFSELTEIPVTTAAVSNTYNAVEATLPTENEVKVLNSSHQVAITRLAAEYCNQLATNNTFQARRDVIFGAGVLTQTPAAVNRQNVIIRITDAFWGVGIIEASELADAREELLILYDEMIEMDVSPTQASANAKAIRGVCTAALSSAYVTMM